ncbi:MAG: helix-turn-helix domain-containing protein [Candidatus Parvarchaeota archaeon]
MLSPSQKEKIKEMKENGISISKISKELHIARNTVKKYLDEISMPKEESKENTEEESQKSENGATIKDIERATRTAIAGQKEGKAVAEAYMEFKDELDEEMTKKLVALRWKYDDYLKKHNISFGDFVEETLEKRMIWEAIHYDQSAPKFNFKEFLNGVLIVKALDRL